MISYYPNRKISTPLLTTSRSFVYPTNSESIFIVGNTLPPLPYPVVKILAIIALAGLMTKLCMPLAF